MSKSPQRFRPYNTPDEETSPDAKTRRIDSPAAQEQDVSWQQMVKPEWRAPRRRSTTKPTCVPGRLPGAQKVGAWLNAGGAKLLIGVAGAVVLLFLLLLVINRPGSEASTTPTPLAQSALGNL